jgi:hypothetical protein
MADFTSFRAGYFTIRYDGESPIIEFAADAVEAWMIWDRYQRIPGSSVSVAFSTRLP